jgi:ParB family chromosome partitioning protein|tara:strand:+ start:2153 stop:3028 length:876 start_codon:yes stop_codon:yes gene_type:complete
VSRKKLGRGLDALLGSEPVAAISEQGEARQQTARSDSVPVDQVYRSGYQPRKDFDEEALAELADSIRTQGLLQPIVVRPRAQGGFELIAGERRWRACQLAGLADIPAVIRDVSDERASTMALIENIQREDLTPLEEAGALARLKTAFDLTQEQVAQAVGKSRVAVANLLRLLNLSAPVRQMLAANELEMGHARALLTLEVDAQLAAANVVVEKGLSVRQTEALVRRMLTSSEQPGDSVVRQKDPDTLRLEQDLTDRIGAPARIDANAAGKGKLLIRFSSLDELQGILEHIR